MPMVLVACRACGALVLARKSTWSQTSVQWNADATARCAERAAAQQVSAPGGRDVFLACSALSESILDAVRHGDLALVDDQETVIAASPRASRRPTDGPSSCRR
ncbi:MAG: ferredoxin [Mycobacterium sp.]